MIVLGWILFAVTIFVLIWRDVRLQTEAEKRSVEDLKFIIDKQIEWRSEKRNYQQRISDLVFQLAKVRQAIDEGNKSDSRERECVNRWPGCESGCFDPRCCRWPKSCSCS